MVRDHPLQEQALERRPARGRKRRHLLGRRHPLHAGMIAAGAVPAMVGAVTAGRRVGRGLAALAQPLLHELDLVGLRRVDPLGHVQQLLACWCACSPAPPSAPPGDGAGSSPA
jgi:hypothetical protein